VPASGHARSVGDLGQHLDFRGVGQFKFPERAVAKDSLPRNGASKVLKGRLGVAIIAESEKV
jgi:hypothetical protein